jgi:mono/diheme cytochrome c family protein
MESFGSRRTRTSAFRLAFLAVAAACGGCAPAPLREVAQPPAFESGVELPAGQGRDLLAASCLGCHDLSALPLFAPFYTRDSWRTLLVTMQAHGAEVSDADVEVLADYLAQHFGQEAR